MLLSRTMNKLLILIIMMLLPVMVSRGAVEIDGIYYSFNYSKKTAEVSNSPNKYSGKIVIPETICYLDASYNVTSIGYYAFRWCSGLTSVTIPSSVTSIGDEAFEYCSGLTSISIPSSVTSIGNNAFWGCSGLTSISIPSSVTSIGKKVFTLCSGLTSIVVDINNSKFDSRDNCNAIIETSSNCLIAGCKNTFIPSSVTSIGNSAFQGCSNLTSITIPSGVASIGDWAFRGCNSLTTVLIPSSVISIGSLPFSGCSNLKSIVVDNNNSKYDSRDSCNAVIETSSNCLIAGCKNTFLPYGVTSIGDYAFFECTGLTSLTFPSTVTEIGQNAFGGCDSQISLTIPSSMTSIGIEAFSDWRGLTSVTIPSSVTSIKYCAFAFCTGLTDVYCYANEVPITNEYAFYNGDLEEFISNVTLHVPSSSVEAYKSTEPWNRFKEVVAMEKTNKEAYAVLSPDNTLLSFYYDDKKDNREGAVYNEENFRTNGGNGWAENNDHRNVITVRFDESFSEYNGLTNTSSWFHYFENLKSVEGIKNLNTANVTDMSAMFYWCRLLTDLDLSELNTSNVISMKRMFEFCSSLNSLTLSGFDTKKVTDMSGMFCYCENLKELDLSNFNTANVTSMTYDVGGVLMFGMFCNCSNLETIYIGPNWNTDKVSNSVNLFSGCTSLVGGDGTVFDENYIDKTKAYAGIGGYLTLKEEDDLQRYLDSLGDTEDEMADGVYRRQFKNNEWQSGYLPFALNHSDWSDHFDVAIIHGLSEGGNGILQALEATIVNEGTIEANTPFLIRAKAVTGDVLQVNVTSTDPKVREFAFDGENNHYSIIGNYSKRTGLFSASHYRICDGWLNIPLRDNEVLLPYRWYLTIGEESVDGFDPGNFPARLHILDGQSTDINSMKISQSNYSDKVYDLRGKQIEIKEGATLPKGVYIVNNKKVIIK